MGRCQVWGGPLCKPLTSELVSRSSSPHYFYAHTSGSSKTDIQDSQNTHGYWLTVCCSVSPFYTLVVISVFGVVGLNLFLPWNYFPSFPSMTLLRSGPWSYGGHLPSPAVAASSHGNPKLKAWESLRYSLQHLQFFPCQVEKMTSLRRGTFLAWFAHSVKERYLKSFGVSHYQLSLDWI